MLVSIRYIIFYFLEKTNERTGYSLLDTYTDLSSSKTFRVQLKNKYFEQNFKIVRCCWEKIMLSPVIDKTSLKVLSYKAKDAIVDFHIASVCSLSAYDVSSYTTDS